MEESGDPAEGRQRASSWARLKLVALEEDAGPVGVSHLLRGGSSTMGI